MTRAHAPPQADPAPLAMTARRESYSAASGLTQFWAPTHPSHQLAARHSAIACRVCSGFPRDDTTTDRETRSRRRARCSGRSRPCFGAATAKIASRIPHRSPSSGRTRPGRRRRSRWRRAREAMKGDAKKDGEEGEEGRGGGEGGQGGQGGGGRRRGVRFLQVRKADRARPPSSRGRTASTPPRTPRRTSSKNARRRPPRSGTA